MLISTVSVSIEEMSGQFHLEENLYPGAFITIWVQKDGRILRGLDGDLDGAVGIRLAINEVFLRAETEADIEYGTNRSIRFDASALEDADVQEG